MRRLGWLLATANVWLSLPATSIAQTQSTRLAASPLPGVATAVRAAPDPPSLDGRLDDAAWAGAPVIDHFVQREPHEGQEVSERTEARVVYTDAALYVAVRAFDSRAAEIGARLTRRDDDSPSDWIGILVDSYRDRRTAFEFAVNPAGVKRDVYHYDDVNDDSSWDAVWEVAVTRDQQGWTAEFRIPFSQLRFPGNGDLQFGFNIYRKISRLNELQQWKLVPKNASGVVSQYGDLTGIRGIRPPRRLEILPYTVTRSNHTAREAGNPFRTGTDRGAEAGADLKFGVTSNLTLSATINPDFGQVEADPAQVNLSAFESFFAERRPFFSEGSDIFRFRLGGGDQNSESLFYTRRIGRPPQGEAIDRGGFTSEVRNTSILGAAKLSGKTPSGWTIGLAGAVTEKERVSVIDSLGARFSDVVEPATTYLVGRLAREYRNGQTRVGLFGTAVNRSLPSSLQNLRHSAYTLGLDWNHRFRNDTYYINGWIVGSDVFGSANAINETQRASAHYFQRPDNDYAGYDSTRTSLRGFASSFSVGKGGGGSWRFSTGVDTRSPGFEVNDAGYMQSADWHGQFVWINHRWLKPGNVFRSVSINLNEWSNWTYGWDHTNTGGNINGNFRLLNYWGGYAGINRNTGGLAPEALRGGPLFLRPSSVGGWYGFYSDDRKPLRFALDGWWGFQQAGGTHWRGISPKLSWRPVTNLDFSLSPNLNWNVDDWQYLDQADPLGSMEYIFGELHQTTASMTFRGDLTFTPTLTLQLYAEPFVASGYYTEFKRVADPRAQRYADRFDVFGNDRLVRQNGEVSVDLNRDGTGDIDLGNPDFKILSFRSNVVLRWEYRSGSTIFMVWQHGRNNELDNGRFGLRSDFGDIFRSVAENTFLIKVNYWLSL